MIDQALPLSPVPRRAAEPRDDESRLLFGGISWGTNSAIHEMLDRPGIRMSYLNGVLEIMSPSQKHERLKKQIARLIELYATERNVPLYGYGSTTFRAEAKERGLEPDECYCIGHDIGEVPDIAVEVSLTSGGLDKLSIYAGLGVPEVWYWRNDRFELYALVGESYAETVASARVPELDFARLAEFVREPDQHVAVTGWVRRLREGR
jgi:Uma2 family endonuclease